MNIQFDLIQYFNKIPSRGKSKKKNNIKKHFMQLHFIHIAILHSPHDYGWGMNSYFSVHFNISVFHTCLVLKVLNKSDYVMCSTETTRIAHNCHEELDHEFSFNNENTWNVLEMPANVCKEYEKKLYGTNAFVLTASNEPWMISGNECIRWELLWFFHDFGEVTDFVFVNELLAIYPP